MSSSPQPCLSEVQWPSFWTTLSLVCFVNQVVCHFVVGLFYFLCQNDRLMLFDLPKFIIVAIVLSGSSEERGLKKLKRGVGVSGTELEGMRSYDLPFGMTIIRRYSFFKYLPISPAFTGYQWGRLQKACRSRMGPGEVVKGGGMGGEGGSASGESRV